MNNEKMAEACDAYSGVIRTVIELISRHLKEEYGITLMGIGRLMYFHPKNSNVRSFSFARGCFEVLDKVVDELKDDFKEEFEKKNEFSGEDIKTAFEILEKQKKPFLN